MRVISQSPDPLARMHTMTKRQGKSGTIDVKALLAEDEEFLRALVRTALQEVLEAEMTEALGAEKSLPWLEQGVNARRAGGVIGRAVWLPHGCRHGFLAPSYSNSML